MLRKASSCIECSTTRNTSNRGKTLKLTGFLFKRGRITCDVRVVHGLRVKTQETMTVELGERVCSEKSKPAHPLQFIGERRHQSGNLQHIAPPLLQPLVSMWCNMMSSVQRTTLRALRSTSSYSQQEHM
eukprot:3105615-Heterocapsa_arctica.AAC.1